MADNTVVQLFPRSVNYLTSKLESDNLIKRAQDLVLDSNFAASSVPARVPKERSTGNTLIYLSGEAVAQGAVSPTDVIATIPVELGVLEIPSGSTIYLPVITSISAVLTNDIVGLSLVNGVTTLTYEGAGLTASDIVYLDSIHYFTTQG